jgi:hypothetical protein
MLASVRVWLVALVVAVALPQIGEAQGITTFDGTYKGVSNTTSGGRMCTPTVPVPRPLTIRNGAVSWAGGLTGNTQFQGTVNAQGNISARSVSGQTGIVFTGTVANGRITGGGSVAGTSCSLVSVWQKQ